MLRGNLFLLLLLRLLQGIGGPFMETAIRTAKVRKGACRLFKLITAEFVSCRRYTGILKVPAWPGCMPSEVRSEDGLGRALGARLTGPARPRSFDTASQLLARSIPWEALIAAVRRANAEYMHPSQAGYCCCCQIFGSSQRKRPGLRNKVPSIDLASNTISSGAPYAQQGQGQSVKGILKRVSSRCAEISF